MPRKSKKKTVKKLKNKSTKAKTKAKTKTQKRGHTLKKSCPLIKKCAPHIYDSNKQLKGRCPCSCFSRESLLKIAKAWNRYNDSGNEVGNKADNIKIYRNISSKRLKNVINTKLRNKCKEEWCWIQQEFIKRLNDDEFQEFTF